MSYWKRGEQAELARVAGIKPQNLSDILHRRVGVSAKRAKELESASISIGKCIGWQHWVGNRFTDHPGFYTGD